MSLVMSRGGAVRREGGNMVQYLYEYAKRSQVCCASPGSTQETPHPHVLGCFVLLLVPACRCATVPLLCCCAVLLRSKFDEGTPRPRRFRSS